MNKLLTSTLLIVALTSPSICTGQETKVTSETIEVRGPDFTLQLPATWTYQNDGFSPFQLLSPIPEEGELYRENIRIKKYNLTGNEDLDGILKTQEESVEDQFVTIGSGDLGSSDHAVRWLAIKEKKPEPGYPPLAKVDYMIINQGKLFVLHAMCEVDRLKENQLVFNSIAKSLRFNPQAAAQTTYVPPRGGAGTESPTAFNLGKSVGRYTVFAMLAAVGIWLVVRVAKFSIAQKTG